MKAVLDGITLAESDETLKIEGNHYFPPDSVSWQHLESSRRRSVCPWKGVASYYDVGDGGRVARGAAWTYERPLPWIRKLRGHVAFWAPVTVSE